MKRTLIITSIAKPNKILNKYSEECKKNNVEFIIIGDRKSPKDFMLKDCSFVDIEKQRKLPFKITKYLPENHYSRKNIGYLLAVKNKSDLIIETDDDNFPISDFWKERELIQKSKVLRHKGNVNVYKYFTKKHIWPRGLPLESITKDLINLNEIDIEESLCPIQQGLANGSPDVDAIFRLTQIDDIYFEDNESLALSENAWCPFNSQNTTWFKEAFALLYLPSFCSFRMTDIWRSYIAQRIAWTCSWNILFHKPTVEQIRNEHNLMVDFKDEVVGYLNNGKIVESLQNLNLKKGFENIENNLLMCYEWFIREKLIDKKELVLIESWLDDIKTFI